MKKFPRRLSKYRWRHGIPIPRFFSPSARHASNVGIILCSDGSRCLREARASEGEGANQSCQQGLTRTTRRFAERLSRGISEGIVCRIALRYALSARLFQLKGSHRPPELDFTDGSTRWLRGKLLFSGGRVAEGAPHFQGSPREVLSLDFVSRFQQVFSLHALQGALCVASCSLRPPSDYRATLLCSG